MNSSYANRQDNGEKEVKRSTRSREPLRERNHSVEQRQNPIRRHNSVSSFFLPSFFSLLGFRKNEETGKYSSLQAPRFYGNERTEEEDRDRRYGERGYRRPEDVEYGRGRMEERVDRRLADEPQWPLCFDRLTGVSLSVIQSLFHLPERCIGYL